ncbi:MAG: carbohydrate kinase family protein, partial [Anaerolineae bacterium]|nr:carbohydrate kinase family protein [Anaerolineae bacterium]
SKALTTLGNSVRFLSMVGSDTARILVRAALEKDGINGKYVIDGLETTPQSAILYDRNGTRQINVDLKDIQERAYPQVLFEQALNGCSIAILSNINFSRPFLEAAKRAGKTVVTDVHAISNIEDDYNRDYMAAADILFMSHELLPTSPEDWARWVMHRYGTEVVVIGLGADGALLGVKSHHHVERVPAMRTRPVVNTIGAGDALLSAFVHVYNQTRNPYDAIRRAMVYASYKIGAASAADGFLSQDAFDDLCRQAHITV